MGALSRKISYLAGLVEKHGLVGLAIKFIEKRNEPVDRKYRDDFRRYLPTEEELDRQRRKENTFSYRPLISIVVPAYRTPEPFLRELIASLRAQSYQNWELCIADGSGQEEPGAADIAGGYGDPRIKYLRLEENGGISRNTNEGFSVASGEYIGLMDHDDLLAPNALYEVVRVLNEEKSGERPMLIYSDEDKVSFDLSCHYEPHFKPDYNEELLNHYNYVCHFFVFHRDMLDQVGMLDAEFDGAQDYDFVLRCTERVDKKQIAHVAKVLYHWRVYEASTAGFSGHKDYAYEAGKRAVQAHYDRLRRQNALSGVPEDKTGVQDGECEEPVWTDTHVFAVRGREYVNAEKSVSLPADRYMVCAGEDIYPRDADWSSRLLQNFAGHKDKVGMAGGKLVSSKRDFFGRVLACGYTFDKNGIVHPVFYGLNSFKKGYYRRAAVSQNVSACSLDFCVIDKRAMEEAGGIDRTLPPPYRDMDFAFRLRRAGYQVILDAGVTARVARQAETSPGMPAALEENKWSRLLVFRWKEYIEEGDPFYNENIRCDGSL